MENKICRDRYRGKQDLIFTVENKKKIWKDIYRGKQVQQDLIFTVVNKKRPGTIVTVINIFTVVNKKKVWKDRYRGKHLYRGKQEKDLERSLPW